MFVYVSNCVNTRLQCFLTVFTRKVKVIYCNIFTCPCTRIVDTTALHLELLLRLLRDQLLKLSIIYKLYPLKQHLKIKLLKGNCTMYRSSCINFKTQTCGAFNYFEHWHIRPPDVLISASPMETLLMERLLAFQVQQWKLSFLRHL